MPLSQQESRKPLTGEAPQGQIQLASIHHLQDIRTARDARESATGGRHGAAATSRPKDPWKLETQCPERGMLAWVDDDTARLAAQLGGFDRIRYERYGLFARILELERELIELRSERNRLRNPAAAFTDWMRRKCKSS